MTPDDLKSFLEANKADIEKAVKEKVISGLLQSYHWDITSEINQVVKDFVSTEIVPALKEHLQSQKGPLMEAALLGASTMGDTLAKAVAENAAKNLTSDSYKFRAVMKALFE